MKKKTNGNGWLYFLGVALFISFMLAYWWILLIMVVVFIVFKIISNLSTLKKDKNLTDTISGQNKINQSPEVLEPPIQLKSQTVLATVDLPKTEERFTTVHNAEVVESGLKIPIPPKVSFLKNMSNITTLNDREEALILPEYQHIKTPHKILKSLKQVKNRGFKRQKHSYEEFVRDSMGFSTEARAEISSKEPIETTYPTFKMLNDSQKDSYFYWRSQVLNGNFSNMDDGYMTLFMYELINYSFNQNSAFNISMMIRLHQECDTCEYQVERWISDMLYEVGEVELAQKWFAEPMVAPRPSEYRSNYFFEVKSDYIYQKILEGKALSEIPARHWRGYTKNYRETQFFTTHQEEIYDTFEKAITLLNQVYEQEEIKVLDRWFSEEKGQIDRRLFSSAVIGRNLNNLDLQVKIKRKLANETMINEITSLFRLSDNVTRLMYGEKSKIKVDETCLPENFKALMLDTLIPKTTDESTKIDVVIHEPQWIDFDLEQISKLQDDSESLANLIENDEHQSKDFDTDHFQEFETVKIVEDKPIESDFVTNEFFSLFESDDHGDESVFVEMLTQLEKNFLLAFKNMQLTQSEANQFARKSGSMTGLIVSKINEKAQEYLGDNVIETVGDRMEIYVDYENILEMLKEQTDEN